MKERFMMILHQDGEGRWNVTKKYIFAEMSHWTRLKSSYLYEVGTRAFPPSMGTRVFKISSLFNIFCISHDRKSFRSGRHRPRCFYGMRPSGPLSDSAAQVLV